MTADLNDVVKSVEDGEGCPHGKATRTILITLAALFAAGTLGDILYLRSVASAADKALVTADTLGEEWNKDQRRQDAEYGNLMVSTTKTVDAVNALANIVAANSTRITSLETGRSDNAGEIKAIKAKMDDIQAMAHDTNLMMHQHMESH